MRTIRITNEDEVGDTCEECKYLCRYDPGIEIDTHCQIYMEKPDAAYPRCQAATVGECDHVVGVTIVPINGDAGIGNLRFVRINQPIPFETHAFEFCPECGAKLGEE